MKKTIVIGNKKPTTTSKKINDFAKEISVTELNPFAPESFYITDPYKKFKEEVVNTKYFEKPRSKYHK